MSALVLVDAAGFSLGGPDRPRFVGIAMIDKLMGHAIVDEKH